jgi:GNAT superfamily N-acetyltransferase
MTIRNASFKDTSVIRDLLEQLGYRVEYPLLMKQVSVLLSNPDNRLLVTEQDNQVVAFCSVCFMQQIENDGELALINYLVVDEKVRGQGIGKALENYVSEIAWSRKCDRIQLHCHEWRTKAHQFYKQRGYQEYPTYFSKRLIYAE